MPTWKDTSNHWSKTDKREEVVNKVKKYLQPQYWKGKKRDSETMRKLQEGKIRWIKDHPEEYKLSRAKVGLKISGENNINWNGGIMKTVQGYVRILSKDHPNKDRHGYVLEHRLVMEKHLGRYLRPEEVVDHINGIKNDNRIENLRVFSRHSDHVKTEWQRDVFKTRKPKTEKICPMCGKVKLLSPCQLREINYCSRKCMNNAKIGKPSWNKGIKIDRNKYPHMGNFRKVSWR